MTVHRSVEDVLAAAEQTLELARQGWADYRAGGERRFGGLTTAIVNARAVTNVLQNARHLAPGFDRWWDAYITILDYPAGAWFKNVRNRIEKQGSLGTTSVSLTGLTIDSHTIDHLQRHAPPGTVSTFFGDQLGRNGWIVRLADGSEKSVYFQVPASVVTSALHIEDAPEGKSVEELFPGYLRRLERLVEEARKRFSG